MALRMRFPRPEFMRLALRLARKGAGRTSPNPAVGAVLVRGGKVVGQGDHGAAGLPHAEVVALRAAGSSARGADLYVTLEPSAHTGRTGPCTGAIIAAGVKRVAAAMLDPNPFVALKLAVSMDGQIAASSGESRWISGEAARTMVHRMRAEADAVLVGGRTFRRDAPMLTARVPRGRNPKRVILTSRLDRVARSRRFFEEGGEVIVAAPRSVPRKDADRLRARGARVLLLPARKGRIGADAFLAALASIGIPSLLVEGGGKTAGWLVEAGAVDRCV